MVRDRQKLLGRFAIETTDGHRQEIRVIGEGESSATSTGVATVFERCSCLPSRSRLLVCAVHEAVPACCAN